MRGHDAAALPSASTDPPRPKDDVHPSPSLERRLPAMCIDIAYHPYNYKDARRGYDVDSQMWQTVAVKKRRPEVRRAVLFLPSVELLEDMSFVRAAFTRK